MVEGADVDLRKALAVRSLEVMASGAAADFAAVLHPDFFNHEQRDEPPATRGSGPETAYGVARWLRDAYAGLDWEVHEVVAEGDLVAVHCTMSGRHVADFVAYDLDGRVADAFAPTGRRFATTQSHWLRVRDGRLVEHWANRDDMGTAEQLGWVPPSPRYLVRCALAKRRARRAADPPRRAEERLFGRSAGGVEGPKRAALEAIELMRGAPLEAFERAIHPDALNRERSGEPPAARGRGPAAFQASARWLNEAFAELDRTIHHVVAEDDLVVVHLTLAGRHAAPFVTYDEAARVDAAFPPTGRRFAVTETHWLRVADDGRVIERWANRDDLGMAAQLGWIPPTPRYLARMALAKRRAHRPRSRLGS